MVSKGVGIGIGVAVAIIIVALVIIPHASQIQQNVITIVSVSGTAQTTGVGTKPVFVDFIDENTQQAQSVNVDGGSYSISLNNNHNYNIVLHYSAGLGITSGTCQAGVLSLYSTQSDMQRNISC